jgi:hypothetical protein
MKKQQGGKGKPASPDSLANGKKGGAELNEAQLKGVSGGIKLQSTDSSLKLKN